MPLIRLQKLISINVAFTIFQVQPQTFAGLLGIVQLPPKDFGILARSSSEAITPNDIGIADVFLSCIAKALTLQVKKRVTRFTQFGFQNRQEEILILVYIYVYFCPVIFFLLHF